MHLIASQSTNNNVHLLNFSDGVPKVDVDATPLLEKTAVYWSPLDLLHTFAALDPVSYPHYPAHRSPLLAPNYTWSDYLASKCNLMKTGRRSCTSLPFDLWGHSTIFFPGLCLSGENLSQIGESHGDAEGVTMQGVSGYFSSKEHSDSSWNWSKVVERSVHSEEKDHSLARPGVICPFRHSLQVISP
jgi:hypothetical protein